MLWQQVSTPGRGCEDSWLATTVSCRNGDLTSGPKMPQIGRFRAICFRVIIVTGVHASKTSRAQQKGRLSVACHSRPASGRAQRLEVPAHPFLAGLHHPCIL